MTALEALENYSHSHAERIDDLLEWPYRRFMKAFNAHQRREAIEEIKERRNLHVSALNSIVEWKEPGDQQEAIESTEEYYEMLSDYVWEPERSERENKEMQQLESEDSFLAAGKRNLMRNLGPAEMPGQNEIEESL